MVWDSMMTAVTLVIFLKKMRSLKEGETLFVQMETGQILNRFKV